MDMNEIKNNSPKRPVIFYYAIALIVLLALNFILVPDERAECSRDRL